MATWDIFCSVVDNFGDIGVCWRLARQLAAEHSISVRLWVDDMSVFQVLCPKADSKSAIHPIEHVEVRSWVSMPSDVTPHAVVVEAFACNPPDAFVEAMAALPVKPIWINLEYLSAEDWVEGCHRLSARHPRLPLTRHFFFPGFTPKTGGLIRESALFANRDALQANPIGQWQIFAALGATEADQGAERISLFCYDNPALPRLLAHWQQGAQKLVCVADGKPRQQIEHWLGTAFRVGTRVQRGALTLIALPFLSQSDYDQLLWSCNMNFIRGEDSFVRAQWAGRPLVWHIYPQDEQTHLTKLDAFLDQYAAQSPALAADAHSALRAFHRAWNEDAGARIEVAWDTLAAQAAPMRQHAEAWAEHLAAQPDLASQLTEFAGQLFSQAALNR
ncbi:MAG: elongation factor P maturation arginine rhamnosyltransferase EarP [Burkholderiales bacterium]|nr:elongation factor P maturation arginine rhamnosyltransferase EarP [Burkholderiales bacterium]